MFQVLCDVESIFKVCRGLGAYSLLLRLYKSQLRLGTSERVFLPDTSTTGYNNQIRYIEASFSGPSRNKCIWAVTILYDGHISLYDSRAGQKTEEASIEFSKEMA